MTTDEQTQDDVVSDAAAKADHRQANLDAALRLANAGLPVFPVRIVQNETGEWHKRPLVRGWQQIATTDPVKIRKWWDEFPDAVPGIELERTGLIVIDADRHVGGPDGVSAMKKLIADRGHLPDGPRTKTAGDGLHFIFQQPDGVRLGNGEGSLPDGINVRGAGGFVIGTGAVRPDGARYRTADGAVGLTRAFATGTIPRLPDSLADIIRKKHLGNDNAGPIQDLDLSDERGRAFATAALVKCVEEIEKARRGTRNNTLNAVAYRLGRMVARSWLQEHAVVDELSGACQINGLARDDGMESVRGTIESGLMAGRAHPHSDLQDRPFPEDEYQSAPNTESPPLIPVVWDGEVKHNPTKWLVRDLIPMDSIGLLVGESTSGKSFAALDLARALGKGDVFLTKPARKGGTLYVAAEAAGTIPGRLEAARLGPIAGFLDERGRFKDNGLEPDKLPIAIMSHPPSLLDESEVKRLIATAKDVSIKMQNRFQVPLRLVVIDTLLAAFPINDWNSPAEVSRVMEVLARIAKETGALVLGVHHHGKDVSRGPAGSFALKAASDIVLAVFADIDDQGNVSGRRITVSKLRDGQTGWGCDFDLVPHKIGTDDYGLDILSAFLRPKRETAGFGKSKPTKPKTQSQASIALEDALSDALGKFGVNRTLNGSGPEVRVVPISNVREIFNQHYKPDSGSGTQDAIRSAFNRAMNDARRKGTIGEGRWNDTDWVWRPE